MYSDDLRWRIVCLLHIYDLEISFVSDIFGPNLRTIVRWYNNFLKNGTVRDNLPSVKESRWPNKVVLEVKKYVQ